MRLVCMKYEELVGIKEGYNDVFDMVDEQKGYWKNFVTNKQFEDNLLRIMKVFDSPVTNDHKSIWVQGTYGTGKSHSTSVIKHLLSDPLEEIQPFINNLMSHQLRSEILAYRSRKKIFPVVIKGNHNISEASDMNSVIQTEIKKAFKRIGVSLTVKSDFETITDILKKPVFSAICDELVNNDLSNYVGSKEELFDLLAQEDPGILKIIHRKFKDNQLFAATNDITRWLKEVRDFIRKENIANELVIFWDEFTSLLSISERRAIYSITQDIAELSKTEEGGIYIFLITHISFETTDMYKDMGSSERDHIRDRFIVLPYQIHYDTTYTILFSAIKRIRPDDLKMLVDERVKRNMEVDACLDAVVSDTVDPADSKMKIYGLYPFHPYTAYISTFLARIIGSSERSVFNFLNDTDHGFVAFIKNDVESKPFITVDLLWDFFLEKFKENPKFSEIVDVYKKNMDSVLQKGDIYFSLFKSILLLNIMESTAGTDEESTERSLTSPSVVNLERAFSGTYQKQFVDNALTELDEMGIIRRTPDDRYEFAVSSIPKEKISTKASALRIKYATVSDILGTFPASSVAVKKEITDSNNLKRPSFVEFFGAAWKEQAITNKLDTLIHDNKGYVIVALFMHLGFPVSETNTELSLDELRTKLLELSGKEKYRNVVFLQLNNVYFEKRRYDGFLDQMARSEVAAESGSTAESASCKQSAAKWVAQFTNQIKDSGTVNLVFSGTSIPCAFTDVPAKITQKILPAIYKYGLDNQKRIKNTIWKIKARPQSGTISPMLSKTREEILHDGKFKDLLLNESDECVFTEHFEVDPNFPETPVTRLCNEVKKVMDAHINDTNFDVTSHFDWIFKPPYGYIMTEASMAAITLAFRPYINRMFVTSTSAVINGLKMVNFISDLMDYFLRTEKDSSNLHVRFSSQDERDLMELLVTTFGLSKGETDGLLNIKWNLRDKFKRDNKAPIWVLKYVPKESPKLASLFDDLFEFTQKQNDDISEKLVSSLLSIIKDKRLEIINAINQIKKEDCMTLTIKYLLEKQGHPELDVEEASTYLSANLSGDLVFWSERDVSDAIKYFVDKKITPVLVPPEPVDPAPVQPLAPGEIAKTKEELFETLESPSLDKQEIVSALRKFIESKPALAKDLLQLLNKAE